MSRATLRDRAASVRRRLLGYFLPAHSSLPQTLDDDILRHYAGASERMRAARRLWRRGKTLPALVLFREALWLLVLAKLGPNEARPSQPNGEHLQALLRAFDAEGRKAPPALEAAWPLVADADPTALDRLSSEDAEKAAESLDAATAFLSDLLDARGHRRLARRRVRLAWLGLSVCVLLVGAIIALSRPRNVALHRPVTSSSAAFNTNAPGAVDGIKQGQLGFHSALEESPWLVIDLGAEHRIGEIVVYGRSDCCFNQSIPLLAETSRDGKAYKLVDQRATPFSAFDPWVIEPKKLTGRFVRLRTPKLAHLVVAEVEVYGRPR